MNNRRNELIFSLKNLGSSEFPGPLSKGNSPLPFRRARTWRMRAAYRLLRSDRSWRPRSNSTAPKHVCYGRRSAGFRPVTRNGLTRAAALKTDRTVVRARRQRRVCRLTTRFSPRLPMTIAFRYAPSPWTRARAPFCRQRSIDSTRDTVAFPPIRVRRAVVRQPLHYVAGCPRRKGTGRGAGGWG